jgi:surface antigen
LQQITKQACETKSRIACAVRKVVTVAILVMPLCGCMGSGLGMTSTDGVDTSVSTHSTIQPKSQETVSDEMTVRNAVSSADLDKLKNSPLPWANTDTGSAGVVTAINQSQLGSLVCRDFTTTSHSFSGIAKYSGKACLAGNGEWQILSFEKQS